MSQGALIIKTDTSEMHPWVVAHIAFMPISPALTCKSDTLVNGT